jgi:hypothetical protein
MESSPVDGVSATSESTLYIKVVGVNWPASLRASFRPVIAAQRLADHFSQMIAG